MLNLPTYPFSQAGLKYKEFSEFGKAFPLDINISNLEYLFSFTPLISTEVTSSVSGIENLMILY